LELIPWGGSSSKDSPLIVGSRSGGGKIVLLYSGAVVIHFWKPEGEISRSKFRKGRLGPGENAHRGTEDVCFIFCQEYHVLSSRGEVDHDVMQRGNTANWGDET